MLLTPKITSIMIENNIFLLIKNRFKICNWYLSVLIWFYSCWTVGVERVSFLVAVLFWCLGLYGELWKLYRFNIKYVNELLNWFEFIARFFVTIYCETYELVNYLKIMRYRIALLFRCANPNKNKTNTKNKSTMFIL